jgi:hypothetical protein
LESSVSINRLRTLRVLKVVHQHRKLRSEHLLAMLVIVVLLVIWQILVSL